MKATDLAVRDVEAGRAITPPRRKKLGQNQNFLSTNNKYGINTVTCFRTI